MTKDTVFMIAVGVALFNLPFAMMNIRINVVAFLVALVVAFCLTDPAE